MKTAIAAAVCTLASLAFVGCASKQEPGVTTTGRSQYVTTMSDVKSTTDAAKGVMEDAGLMNVMAEATNVDGKVTAKKADGTVVKAFVTRDGTSDKMSKVQVTVGMMGEPTLGADLTNKIKMKADGMSPMKDGMKSDSMKSDSMKSDAMKPGM